MHVLSTAHPFHRHEMVDLGGVTLASFRRRVNAFAVDCALAFAPYLGVVSIVGFYGGRGHEPPGWLPSIAVAKWSTVFVFLAYMTVTTFVARGQTLGKRWQKIRVVALFRSDLSLWQCFERSLGYSASSLEAGFGFAQYFIHPNRQTVHDRIAETVVVNTEPELRAKA
jgi:uncharacterized RDD family membrane protein YckC